MKDFLNPEKLEMKVHDIKDNVHTFKLKSMTCDELDEMANLKIVNSDNPGSSIRKQLSLMFGENEDFFKKFDTRVLTKVLLHITAEIKNPSQEK